MWLIVWLIARTPLPLAAALSWILSWLWWTVVPVRRRLGAATLVLATHLGSWDLIGGLLVSRTGVPSTVVVSRGIPVPFFGRLALTAPSLAVAAAKTGVSVAVTSFAGEGSEAA